MTGEKMDTFKTDKIRYMEMKKLVEKSNPANDIVIDLGAGGKGVSDDINCKEKYKLDILLKNNPSIVCDLSKSIPIKSNSVDICVAGEILEHIYLSNNFIKEIKRILKDNKHLILSVPNMTSAKCRIAFLLGKIPSHAAKADETYEVGSMGGHIRDYNLDELVRLLNRHGFDIIDIKNNGMALRGLTFFPPFLTPNTMGNNIIIRAKVKK